MLYTGTIVEESLKDKRIINDMNVVGMRITNAESPQDRWHLYKVELAESQIESLASQLKPEKWYMHFWNEDNIIAVFPDRTFRFSYSDKRSWSAAIKHGKTLGIPEEQLDFAIE